MWQVPDCRGFWCLGNCRSFKRYYFFPSWNTRQKAEGKDLLNQQKEPLCQTWPSLLPWEPLKKCKRREVGRRWWDERYAVYPQRDEFLHTPCPSFGTWLYVEHKWYIGLVLLNLPFHVPTCHPNPMFPKPPFSPNLDPDNQKQAMGDLSWLARLMMCLLPLGNPQGNIWDLILS